MRRGRVSIMYARSGIDDNPDWCELTMKKLFMDRGFDVEMFDVYKEKGLPTGEIIINRVYPSISNGNGVANNAIRISKVTEQAGTVVINNTDSAHFDYDEFEAYLKLKDAGVPTPETFMFNDIYSALKICEDIGYPLVMKRNSGGKSKGVQILHNIQDAKKKMINAVSDREEYRGQIILQEFIEPQRKHDARIGIFFGEPRLSYGRTLISLDRESPWIASVGMGSDMIDYSPSDGEIEMAMKATESLGAEINEVDMCFGPDGPVIIENNLTPGYDYTEIEKIKLLVDSIIGGKYGH